MENQNILTKFKLTKYSDFGNIARLIRVTYPMLISRLLINHSGLRAIFIMLYTVIGITIPALAQNGKFHPVHQTVKSQGPVVLDKLAWAYPSANQPAAVRIKITNNSGKTIKSTKFLVIARDKKGVLLQSDGSTIQKLINTDTIKASESREIYFEKAYNNPHIAEMELKGLTVEYTNGALEIIK